MAQTVKNLPAHAGDTGDVGFISGLGISPGGGTGVLPLGRKDGLWIDGQVSFLCPTHGAAGPWESGLLRLAWESLRDQREGKSWELWFYNRRGAFSTSAASGLFPICMTSSV